MSCQWCSAATLQVQWLLCLICWCQKTRMQKVPSNNSQYHRQILQAAKEDLMAGQVPKHTLSSLNQPEDSSQLNQQGGDNQSC